MKEKKWESKYNRKIKIKKIIIKLVYFIMIISIILNITYNINKLITKKDYFEIFNISFHIKKDNLMEKEIKKNDLLLAQKINSEELLENDIIAYKINEEIRIDKIIKINKNEGKTTYITKANKNLHPNIENVTEEKIIGKIKIKIPFLGIIIEKIQSRAFSIICIVILALNLSYNKYINEKKIERKQKKNIIKN